MKHILVLIAIVTIAAPALAAEDSSRQGAQKTDQAIDSGLRWLAARQGENGAFAPASTHGWSSEVADTAFCGLAFLAEGSKPDEGKFAKPLRRAIDFLIANQQESGLISTKSDQPKMYVHGYATLFLAEAYIADHDPKLRQALHRAVGLIERSANSEGGWRYLPQPRDADVSVTACELNALLAARAAGVDVDEHVIEAGLDYVRHCQTKDGGFSYMAGQEIGSGAPRSAAALAVLFRAAAKSDQSTDAALKYLIGAMSDWNKASPGHYFYGCYYLAQCAQHSEELAGVYERLARQLVDAQTLKGSWSDDVDEVYATANAVIVLQAPQRHLWIFRPAK